MNKQGPNGIVWLSDKLKSWPGEMALTSGDIADLLAILSDYEAALPLLEAVRKKPGGDLIEEIRLMDNQPVYNDSSLLCAALAYVEKVLLESSRERSEPQDAKGENMEHESLESQVERLANFIMAEVPGEPSQSEGAIDTAIRVIRKLQKPAPPTPRLFCEADVEDILTDEERREMLNCFDELYRRNEEAQRRAAFPDYGDIGIALKIRTAILSQNLPCQNTRQNSAIEPPPVGTTDGTLTFKMPQATTAPPSEGPIGGDPFDYLPEPDPIEVMESKAWEKWHEHDDD